MSRPPFKIERFAEGVGDMDKHFEAIRAFSEAPAVERMAANFWDGRWCEVTEEVYDYYLNVLPPQRWHNDMFSISEYQTEDVTAVLIKSNIGGQKRYFMCWCNMSDARGNMRIMRNTIEEQIGAEMGMSVVTGQT